MTIDYATLKAWTLPQTEQHWAWQDSALYALGVGLGHDSLDEDQLAFVYEKAMKALPTMPVVLGNNSFWLRDPGTGVDWKRVVHGEERLERHASVPVEGVFSSTLTVEEIIDKGPGKGALILSRRDVFEVRSGTHLATVRRTTFARGDGGFGGPSGPAPAPHRLPEDRPPDRVCDLPTEPDQALVYRLNGDFNPLHADPQVAREAGFERPILHGLCTFGVAGHAVLKSFCGYDPSRLRRFDVRFSAPVFPGETIRTEMWRDGAIVSFRARAVERDIVVLNNGLAELA